MKKFTLILLIIIALFSSCKKDELQKAKSNYMKIDGVEYLIKTCIVEKHFRFDSNSDFEIYFYDVNISKQTHIDMHEDYNPDLSSIDGMNLLNFEFEYYMDGFDEWNGEQKCEKIVWHHYYSSGFGFNFKSNERDFEKSIPLGEGGSLCIEKSNGKYIIDFNCVGDSGQIITGYYSGAAIEVEIND